MVLWSSDAMSRSQLTDINTKYLIFCNPISSNWYWVLHDNMCYTFQVLLRFLVELGLGVVPKSANQERMKENIDVMVVIDCFSYVWYEVYTKLATKLQALFINSIGAKDKCSSGPLLRYVKLWVAHVPRMPGTFSPGSAIPACITARASRTCRDACRDC